MTKETKLVTKLEKEREKEGLSFIQILDTYIDENGIVSLLCKIENICTENGHHASLWSDVDPNEMNMWHSCRIMIEKARRRVVEYLR